MAEPKDADIPTGGRRTKVAVVVKYYPPSERISGIIGFLSALLERAAQTLDIVVVAMKDESLPPDLNSESSVSQTRVTAPFPVRAALEVRRLNPDCVVVVSGIYELDKAAAYFAPLAVGGKWRSIFIQATNVADRRGPHVRHFLSRFDHVVGTSRDIVQGLDDLGGRDVRLLSPAVDIPAEVPARSRQFDVGFVNHVNRVKGADLAVAAIEELRSRRPGVAAVIAGTGELAEQLRARTEDHVEWRGWMPPEDRDTLLTQCRVVLFPFRTSVSVLGVSQTVLEAMAHGAVVVGSDTPAISSAITSGANGVLVDDPTDVSRMADEIETVLDDEARQQVLSSAARSDAKAHWDVDRRALEFIGLVDSEPGQMIQFFLGTKAQYIKTAPLIRACADRGVPYRLIDSGQHGNISSVMRNELGIPEPDVHLARSGDITSILQAIRWAAKISLRLARPSRLRRDVFGGRGGICVVHGDTPSTLLSTLLARRAGLRVAHLEAGLRSFNILQPFPEELIRIVVMRVADLLFTPNSDATKNLVNMGIRGEVFQLDGNTTHEPLREALDLTNGQTLDPAGPALVTCHRVENLKNGERLSSLVKLVRRIAEGGQRCIFVVHGPTRQTLVQRKLLQILDHDNIEIRDLVDHETFVRLLADAPFAIIDGGSIQEEAAVIGTPTLVWRGHTERPDGIGHNVVLCEYDEEIVEAFVARPEQWRRPVAMPSSSPSQEALEILLERL